MTDLADSITSAAVNLTNKANTQANKSVNNSGNGKEEQQPQQQRILRSNSSALGGGGGGGGGVNGNSLDGGGGVGLTDSTNTVVGCKAVLVEEKSFSKSNKDKKNNNNVNAQNQQTQLQQQQQQIKTNTHRTLRGSGGSAVGIQQTQLLEFKVRRMDICNASSENDNDTENINNKSNNSNSNNTLNSNTDFEHPPSKKLLTSYNNSPPQHLQQHPPSNRMNVDNVMMGENEALQQQEKSGDNDDSMNAGSNNSNMQVGSNGEAVNDGSEDGKDLLEIKYEWLIKLNELFFGC